MNKIKLIIFDLDGTLLYTLEDLKLSLNYALKKNNLKERTLNETKSFVGNGILKLIERAVDFNKEKIMPCYNDFIENYQNAYQNTYPYENIVETLKQIKKMGIITTILSNKADLAVQNLSNIFFKGLIDFSMGKRDEFQTKPDNKSTLFILNKFKIKKEEALFIGDSEVDIQTANNSGLTCLSVSWGYKDKDFLIKSGAKNIINSPLEILNFL